MTNNSENDKKENAADAKSGNAANRSADKANSPTNSEAKDKLTAMANKAGALATKAFAVGKAATKDVVQELKNVNDIRKETVATAGAGTTKKDLATGFWVKLSAKQKGILTSIGILIVALAYVAIREDDEWNYLLDVCIVPTNQKPIKSCSIKSAKESDNWLVTYTLFNRQHSIFTIDAGLKYPAHLKRHDQTIQMPVTYKKMPERGTVYLTRIAPNQCTQEILYKRDDKKRIFENWQAQSGICSEEQRVVYRTQTKEWREVTYMNANGR
jgi:hypothetical protein